MSREDNDSGRLRGIVVFFGRGRAQSGASGEISSITRTAPANLLLKYLSSSLSSVTPREREEWTKVSLPMKMPTWLIRAPRVWKNTRSPDLRSLRSTFLPIAAISVDVLGSSILNIRPYMNRTNPEQSKPCGVSPPKRYLTPKNCMTSSKKPLIVNGFFSLGCSSTEDPGKAGSASETDGQETKRTAEKQTSTNSERQIWRVLRKTKPCRQIKDRDAIHSKRCF